MNAEGPKKPAQDKKGGNIINQENKLGVYDNMRKEDLITKLKDIEEKFKAEKEDKKKQIESKNKELESKDKLIFSIGGTNKRLLNELDDLKKEVDEKLDKIGMKQLAEKEKEIQKKKRELPYEQVLKVKEKELKNTMNLLEIIKKDKESLQKNLEEKGDLKRLRELEDKLKEEENKNHQLELEIKLCNKLKDEHNKCEALRESYEKEKKTFINEIKFYKDKNKELNSKMKEEEEKQTKLHNYLTNLRSEGISLSGINNNSINSGNPQRQGSSDLNLPNINAKIRGSTNNMARSRDLNLEKYWKLLDKADKTHNNPSDGESKAAEKSPSGKELINISNKNNKLTIKKFDNKKNFSDRQKFSISLSHKTFKVDNEENTQKLFGKEERDIIIKLLPNNEVDKLEKKFELIQRTKIALEKKFQIESKVLSKKVSELEERLEYTNLHNKELEQRNKILGYQINEHKNETKILTRKINEMNTNNSNLKLSLKQKEEENKILVLKVAEYQKASENNNYYSNNNNQELLGNKNGHNMNNNNSLLDENNNHNDATDDNDNQLNENDNENNEEYNNAQNNYDNEEEN